MSLPDLIGTPLLAPCCVAYLDPGAGSMAFQALVAGLLSGAYFCRSALAALKERVARAFRSS